MNLGELISSDAIARMDDGQFRDYWDALGKAVRLACVPAAPSAAEQPEHGELSCTSAGTERAHGWDHDLRRPAVAVRAPFGF
jgi:hypothetical protein